MAQAFSFFLFFLSSFSFFFFFLLFLPSDRVEFFGLAIFRLLPSDREEGFRGTACLRAGTLYTSGRRLLQHQSSGRKTRKASWLKLRLCMEKAAGV
jgi:hypothetical protein